LIAAVVAVACGSDAKPGFKATDVTGASYAQKLELTDHTGKRRTLEDFRGKVVTVFFGFTRCPDICPSSLALMKGAIEALGADGKRVQVVFVTLDPERDTPEVLAQYVIAFDPSFIGLHGTLDETKAAAREFKVFFQKAAGTTPDNYSIDHTAATYVYDPQGRIRLFMRHSATTPDVVADLKLLLAGK